MNLQETVFDYPDEYDGCGQGASALPRQPMGEIRSTEDLDVVLAGFPDDKGGSTALAQHLWGDNLWTRAQQLRDLVAYFRMIAVPEP